MVNHPKLGWGVMLLCLLLSGIPLHAQPFENPKANIPPQAKPQRRSGAEGIPPLPLPATPLRRTERKRQPAPTALIGMMYFDSGFRNGQEQALFPTTQIDIERLMAFANQKLHIQYRYLPVQPDKFSWNPVELPLLYITGWTPMPDFTEEQLAKLRRYLYDGGTIVFHAQCGREEFVKSAERQIARIFPDRDLTLLDSDSELFHAYYSIEHMRVRKDARAFVEIKPLIRAVYLGCRPAILLSPIDLNCGWDVEANPIEGGLLYHQNDALKLGVNIITTALANQQYARTWGTEKIYPGQNEQTRDELVLAQLIHEGDWDPTPHALPNLMKYLQANTTLNVQFKRKTIRLEELEVFQYPVLYMTGLREFQFSEKEVNQLRAYLQNGGILIADAAAGRKAFDVAFRREMQRVLPQTPFQPIPKEDILYQSPYVLESVRYVDLAQSDQPQQGPPKLEGLSLNGQWAVLYSPLSLSNGWEQMEFPYNRGYSDLDALRMGINLLLYALTH